MHLLAKDGEKHFWEFRTIKFEEEGNEPYIIGSAMDITEQHQARKFLMNNPGAEPRGIKVKTK